MWNSNSLCPLLSQRHSLTSYYRNLLASTKECNFLNLIIKIHTKTDSPSRDFRSVSMTMCQAEKARKSIVKVRKSERGNQGRADYRAVKAFHRPLFRHTASLSKHTFHVTPAHQYHDRSYLLQAFTLHIHMGLTARTKQEKLF